MSDRFEEALRGLGEPRPLDPEFRRRLERAVIGRFEVAAVQAEFDELSALRGVDAPREIPAGLAKRLEGVISRKPRKSSGTLLTTTVAASAVLLIILNSAVIFSHRKVVPPPVAAPVLPSPSPIPSTPAPPPGRPPGSLRAFSSAEEFLGYVKAEALKLVTHAGIREVGLSPFRTFGFVTSGRLAEAPPSASQGESAAVPESALPPAGGFSTTNIQEAGVEEPDIVKTDGRRLVALAQDRVWLLDVSRNRLEGSMEISNGIGLLLVGDRLIHIAASHEGFVHGSVQRTQSEDSLAPLPTRLWTKVTVIDVSRPSRPAIVSSIKVEGSYVAARESGGVVRLVVRSGSLGPEPVPLSFPSQDSISAAEAANKKAVRRSVVGHWLPHYLLEMPGRKAETGHVHDWDRISKPPEDAGVSMLTVMTINPADPRPDNAVSVIGSGDIVYASQANLYVTSNRLDDLMGLESGTLPNSPITRIHKFDISDPASARYVASGEVPGYLVNQFSMSEYQGALRVATTVGARWTIPDQPSPSESFVTVLSEEEGRLIPVGSVGGLGKTERIYSVRFIGPLGYVVTFRQVDPLYVIDLQDPRRPEVKGELKIPGFSSYLHPVAENILLGIGRSADESGRVQGLQFSLFDVADPANPRRLHERTVGEAASTEVENDHHAFLYWAETGLMSVPAIIYEGGHAQYFQGALLMDVDSDKGFSEPVRITHQGRREDAVECCGIRRSLVNANRLITISENGVLFSDLRTYADRAWIPFKV